MFTSNKSQIVIQTLAPYSVAYGIFCLILMGSSLSEIVTNWEKIFALAFFSVGISLLQDLVPRGFKEWLVFWRLRERLPGHRAFSKGRRWSSVIAQNEVIDFEIRETLGARFQDRLFYNLYDRYRENGSVKHYSFRYLQWRELATAALVLGIFGYLAVGAAEGWTSRPALQSVGGSLVILIASVFAARNSANSLIDRVLLAESMEKSSI